VQKVARNETCSQLLATSEPLPGELPDELADCLKKLAEAYLPVLASRFEAGSDKLGATLTSAGREEPATATGPPVLGGRIERLEDDLTLRLVLLVRRVAVPLRAMMGQVVFGSLLLCLALEWYPFQPQRPIATFLWSSLIVTTLIVVGIVVRLDRDPFLSRTSGTRPGVVTFDWSLVASIGPYILPTLAFLVTAFPGVSYWLRSVLAPLGNALR
jgi:hypothetical protein